MKKRTPTDATAADRQARFIAQRLANGFTKRTFWIKADDWTQGENDALNGKDGCPPDGCHTFSYFAGYLSKLDQAKLDQVRPPTTTKPPLPTAIPTRIAPRPRWSDPEPDNPLHEASFTEGYIQGQHGNGPLPFPAHVHIVSWWLGNFAGLHKSLTGKPLQIETTTN